MLFVFEVVILELDCCVGVIFEEYFDSVVNILWDIFVE